MAKKDEPQKGEMLVATESFSCRYEGADHAFVAGQTRVRDGHPILKNIRHLFKPIEAHYEHHQVEAATAAPGETRD